MNNEEKLKGLELQRVFIIPQEDQWVDMHTSLIDFFNNINKIVHFRDLKEAMNMIDKMYTYKEMRVNDTNDGEIGCLFIDDWESLMLYREFAKYILTDEEPNFENSFYPEINKFQFEQFKNGTHDIFINPKVPGGIPDNSVLKNFLNEYLERHKTSKTCNEDDDGEGNDLPF